MTIDLGRVVQAAIDAAAQGPNSDGEAKRPKPRLSAGRALLIGAGVVTVGRLAAPKGREMLASLQQMLEESDSDPQDEEQETDEDYDDQPEAGSDEDLDEEQGDDDEPEGEEDEDFDPEDDLDEESEAEADEDDEEAYEDDEEPELDEEADDEERPRRRRQKGRATTRGR